MSNIFGKKYEQNFRHTVKYEQRNKLPVIEYYHRETYKRRRRTRH